MECRLGAEMGLCGRQIWDWNQIRIHRLVERLCDRDVGINCHRSWIGQWWPADVDDCNGRFCLPCRSCSEHGCYVVKCFGYVIESDWPVSMFFIVQYLCCQQLIHEPLFSAVTPYEAFQEKFVSSHCIPLPLSLVLASILQIPWIRIRFDCVEAISFP